MIGIDARCGRLIPQWRLPAGVQHSGLSGCRERNLRMGPLFFRELASVFQSISYAQIWRIDAHRDGGAMWYDAGGKDIVIAFTILDSLRKSRVALDKKPRSSQ
jgi:hypothetical protein